MTLKLPPLPPTQPPWPQFQVWWQQVTKAITDQETDQETVIADLAAAVADIAAAQADIIAAQADATAAIADAAAAAAAAAAADLLTKIGQSWTVPASVLTATDVGADVTIAVAAHTRLYGDGSQLAVNSHNFTGKNYTTDYGIYYDDSTCADATPTYQITTTISNAQNNYAAGRHRVGTVITPAAAGAPTGGGSSPPGGGGDDLDRYVIL